MKVYYLFVLFVIVIGGLAHYNNKKMNIDKLSLAETEQTVLVNNKSSYGIWYIILFLGFFSIQAFRYYVGVDYQYYFLLDVDWSFVIEKFKELDEPFIYLLSFIARSIWDNPLANIIIISLVMTILLFYGLKQYDENDLMYMLLIHIVEAGFVFGLNGMRQALAVTFIFAFSKKSEKNWILKYVIVTFIAFLFHKSALMFLPMLILSQFKITKYQIALLFGCAFAIPMFYQLGYGFMGVEDFSGGYINEQINPIRVLVAFAPLILLLFIDRKKFFEKHYFETNMAIFNAIVTLTTFSSAYLNRFSKYPLIFLTLFIPKVIKEYPKKVRIIVSILVVLLYLIYTSYDMINLQYIRVWHWAFDYIKF